MRVLFALGEPQPTVPKRSSPKATSLDVTQLATALLIQAMISLFRPAVQITVVQLPFGSHCNEVV